MILHLINLRLDKYGLSLYNRYFGEFHVQICFWCSTTKFACSSMYHTIIKSVIAEINCTNMSYNSN